MEYNGQQLQESEVWQIVDCIQDFAAGKTPLRNRGPKFVVLAVIPYRDHQRLLQCNVKAVRPERYAQLPVPVYLGNQSQTEVRSRISSKINDFPEY
jgi:hypothetical protein